MYIVQLELIGRALYSVDCRYLRSGWVGEGIQYFV